jgi:DNA-directed RNA polymerase sigma subunit (sigma70/sigma32)
MKLTGSLSDRLTEREKYLLAQRQSGMTLQEMADYFSVSRERIRQILSKVDNKKAAWWKEKRRNLT